MLRKIGYSALAVVAVAAGIALAQDIGTSSLAAPVSEASMDQRIQAGVVTLNASGVATWTCTTPYEAPPVISYMAIGDGGTYPIQCNFTSVTTTASVVKCYKGAPVTVSILGATVNAFQGSVTGATVHLHARPVT